MFLGDTSLSASSIAKTLYEKHGVSDNYESFSRTVRKWISRERGTDSVSCASTHSPELYATKTYDKDIPSVNFYYTGTPYNGVVLNDYMEDTIRAKGSYDLLIESDAHGWLCDLKAQRVINKILQENHFDEVNMNGDMIDLPYISNHNQRLFGDGILRDYTEVGEVDYLREQILKPKRASTKAKMRLRLGNHDYRLTKPYLLGKGQLARLAVLYKHYETTKFDEMLSLSDLDIVYDDSDICSYFNVFEVTHGLSIAKNAPEQNLNQYMCSGSTGHSHRLGSKYITTRKGTVVWFESGCTRLIEQVEYFPTGIIPQWQQGFVHIRFYLHNNKVKFSGHSYFINEGRCFFNGKLYDGN